MFKPSEKRRLGLEQAIYRKFNSIEECDTACRIYAIQHNKDVTFSKYLLTKYLSGNINFSLKRMFILGKVLGVKDLEEIDEVYTAPRHRGYGYDWIGDNGHRIKDINLFEDHD